MLTPYARKFLSYGGRNLAYSLIIQIFLWNTGQFNFSTQGEWVWLKIAPLEIIIIIINKYNKNGKSIVNWMQPITKFQQSVRSKKALAFFKHESHQNGRNIV